MKKIAEEAKESNNVVLFPKPKMASHPQSLKELEQCVENIKKQTAELIIDAGVGALFKSMQNFNVAVKEKDGIHFMKDVNLIVESVRSAVYRTLEFSHPLQNISNNMFEVSNNNEVFFNESFPWKQENQISGANNGTQKN